MPTSRNCKPLTALLPKGIDNLFPAYLGKDARVSENFYVLILETLLQKNDFGGFIFPSCCLRDYFLTTKLLLKLELYFNYRIMFVLTERALGS